MTSTLFNFQRQLHYIATQQFMGKNAIFFLLYAYKALILKFISESNHLPISINIGIHNGNKMTPTVMTKYQNDIKKSQ